MKYGIQFGVFTMLFGVGFIGLEKYTIGIIALVSSAFILLETLRKKKNKNS